MSGLKIDDVYESWSWIHIVASTTEDDFFLETLINLIIESSPWIIIPKFEFRINERKTGQCVFLLFSNIRHLIVY